MHCCARAPLLPFAAKTQFIKPTITINQKRPQTPKKKQSPFLIPPPPAPHAQQHPNLTSPILNPVDALVFLDCSSGTTGAPKGICCPHRGAVHSYHHRLVNFPYSEGDREACHVFFVWELLRPLLGGMDSAGGVAVPLYVIPDDHIYDPPRCHYAAYFRCFCQWHTCGCFVSNNARLRS